jgi:hypothetical protein
MPTHGFFIEINEMDCDVCRISQETQSWGIRNGFCGAFRRIHKRNGALQKQSLIADSATLSRFAADTTCRHISAKKTRWYVALVLLSGVSGIATPASWTERISGSAYLALTICRHCIGVFPQMFKGLPGDYGH